MQEIIVTGKRQFDHITDAEIHGAPDMPRVLSQAGSNPIGVELVTVLLGAETRHCVIRDVHNVAWQADLGGGGTERIHGTMYDVRVFNIGWQTTAAGDREAEAGGHGQYWYAQNFGATGLKTVDACVFAAGFSWGKIYGTNGHIKDFNEGALSPENKLSGFRVHRSVFVGKSFLVGGVSYGVNDIDITGCSFLDCTLLMGFSGQNGDGSVSDCLLTKGITLPCRVMAGAKNEVSARLVSWEFLDFTGNVVIIPKGAAVDVTYDSPSWLWDGNAYYSEDEKPFVLRRENPKWDPLDPKSPKMLPPQRLTFAEWQATTGFDKNSEYHDGLPTAPMVREYTVDGLGKRASNVAVYNPMRLARVRLPDSWMVIRATVANILNTSDIEEDDHIYMEGKTALPDGWTGGRVAPLPREISPVNGVFRIEAIETDEDEDVAKIAELEAAIAVLKKQAQADTDQIVDLHFEVSKRDDAINAQGITIEKLRASLKKLTDETLADAKIADAARRMCEARWELDALVVNSEKPNLGVTP